MQQDSQSSPVQFPDNTNLLQAMVAHNSQPTKGKVKTFKNRVFRLLMIYAEKSNNLTPLLKALSKDIFFKESDKMGQLVNTLINRNTLSDDDLVSLLGFYKLMLLYNKKNSAKVPETFIKIAKKCQNKAQITNIIKQMLEVFFLQRKSKVNISFFLFLIRKIPSFKTAIFDKCAEIESRITNLRPAQKKQMDKLRSKLMKSVQNAKNQQQVE